MSSFACHNHPADYAEVRQSFSAIDAQRWHQLANDWVHRFAEFKKVRRHLGLPTTADELNVYRALLADLEGQGQLLLIEADKARRKWSDVEIGEVNFRAAVREMEMDLTTALSEELLQPDGELSRIFG